MKSAVANISQQMKLVIIIYFLIGVVHIVSVQTPLADLGLATLVSFGMVTVAIILKNFIKKPNLPGFAWATLVSFFCTIPVSPIGGYVVTAMSNMSFSLVGLPLLAFAGIAVGDQLGVLKKLSWKIVLISFIVMASTYFGSAFISNIVLSMRGMI